MTRLGKSLLGAAAIATIAITGAAPAWAAPSTEIVQGQYLRIVSVADWDQAADLGSAESVQWDLTVSADAPDPGTVTIGVSASGDAPLLMDAFLCSQEWDTNGCPGGAQTLFLAWSVPRDGSLTSLSEMSETDVAHLRLSITLGPRATAGAGTTEVRVHANGAGETVIVGPDGPLPTTGLSPLVAPILVGTASLVIVGGLLLFLFRRRHDDDAERS